MTSREHYQRAMALMAKVQEAEDTFGDQVMPYDELNAWNNNAMRTLKKAELHLMAASLKVTLDR